MVNKKKASVKKKVAARPLINVLCPNPADGNERDPEYEEFLRIFDGDFQARVVNGNKPLFSTDASGLFEAYLKALPPDLRQHHTCHACRKFIEHYGGLVTIDEDGRTSPAMFGVLVDDIHLKSMRAMQKIVENAKVTGVFLTTEKVWGQPKTDVWRHLSVTPSPSMVFRRSTQTAGQAMAEKLEDFKAVMTALNEFHPLLISQAMRVLELDTLYRSEKVLGPATWLRDLAIARTAAKGTARANVVWRAVATAPAGFCHPRSSMIGTLLEDIKAGMDFDDVAKRFAAKMHPLQYQRPQAAPKAGAIAAAEKIVEQLGVAGSLARRFATIGEIEAVWRPGAFRDSAKAGTRTEGVFSHLKTKEDPMVLVAGTTTITFDKLLRTVLPGAEKIELFVPARAPFAALVTAVNMDAPPIIQWDRPEQRNPFSWYLYSTPSLASSWNLSAGMIPQVTAITLRPSEWFGGNFSHQGEGAFFIIDGCKDVNDRVGSCLFPEMLRSEFHGIRAVLESFSSDENSRMDGQAEASACGIMIKKGIPCDVLIRVFSKDMVAVDYRIDRWD